MIQIRQAKHSTTVIRLDSLFAHDDGLPMPQLWDDGDRLGDAIMSIVGSTGFERYGLITTVEKTRGAVWA